jgi:NADH-quinone oxidoreductase subunit N
VGFIGKFQLINAMVNGDYTWLAIVLVVGSMISLGYYLRVIATMWMTPSPTATPSTGGAPALAPIAGASPDADGEAWPAPVSAPVTETSGGGSGGRRVWRGTPEDGAPEVTFVAVVFAAACVFFGIFPSPLFSLAAKAGRALTGLF